MLDGAELLDRADVVVAQLQGFEILPAGSGWTSRATRARWCGDAGQLGGPGGTSTGCCRPARGG
ncbi:MAG: hypothetical protein ACRDZO_28165, partial [Egibacteraceae bacterium]